jgi:hypothetical protein
MAIAVAAMPTITPMATTRTIDPLRTNFEPTRRPRMLRENVHVLGLRP